MNVNSIDKGPSLSRVVMPMIDVMREGSLSWAERENIADAILAVRRHWKSMKDEQDMMADKSAGSGQQRPGRQLDQYGEVRERSILGSALGASVG